MKLAFNQITKIQNLASKYDNLEFTSTNNEIIFKHDSHIITIHHLDLLGIQSGIKGHFNALGMLSAKCKRNRRLENGGLEEFDYVDTNHIKSNRDLRFECDFETISHIKTKNRNSKTLLQDCSNSYIFTGDHFDVVISLLSDSPVRYLKRNFPEIYEYLVEIEKHRAAKLKEQDFNRA